jgi:2-polyprenyl-3-methyl-5-hydroxy-6-metoxy-1,4-benzoquinol methylase
MLPHTSQQRLQVSVKQLAIAFTKRVFNPRIPLHITNQFQPNTLNRLSLVHAALLEHYFAGKPHSFFSSEEGRKHVYDHLIRRLERNREPVIPWLTSLRSLKGARVLEIGCGTGSSTVALAEQGAKVIGIDIHPPSLAVAQARAQAYGLDVRFLAANATDVHRLFARETFDLVLFYATLEHMTVAERLSAIRSTWEMLPPKGLWCVIEAPNRLWYVDTHTAFLPFFHWLPDDLAMYYGTQSKRSISKQEDDPTNSESLLHFLRHGRGVSYHEFEIALGRLAFQRIVSSMPTFLRRENALRWLVWRLSQERRYEHFLARVGPDIHPGYYHEWLHLILEKGE